MAPDLIESELFGHEKGAFTGAAGERKGYFESAHLGCLFLDEIGELPKPAQVRLLRARQEGEVTHVGATAPTMVEEVAADRFREDIFYRLVVIQLLPLREREGDIGLLLEQVNRKSESEGRRLG
jgi:transcriptional regulator with PAS, ATPase and Fis domain